MFAGGATPVDAAGALVTTSAGQVRVDVLEISADQLADLPDDPTDRLYLLSHDWAIRTATPVLIRATTGADATTETSVLVTQPGPLIATKLQALPNRSAAKESTDLLDIVRLTLDQATGSVVRAQLAGAEPQLREDASLHVQRWFVDNAERSLRFIHRTAMGSEIDRDTLALVGELLLASL